MTCKLRKNALKPLRPITRESLSEITGTKATAGSDSNAIIRATGKAMGATVTQDDIFTSNIAITNV